MATRAEQFRYAAERSHDDRPKQNATPEGKPADPIETRATAARRERRPVRRPPRAPGRG